MEGIGGGHNSTDIGYPATTVMSSVLEMVDHGFTVAFKPTHIEDSVRVNVSTHEPRYVQHESIFPREDFENFHTVIFSQICESVKYYINNERDKKDEIVETYNWIKVKKFKDDPSLSFEERFNRLNEHHKEETEFLINKIRGIVNEGYNNKNN